MTVHPPPTQLLPPCVLSSALPSAASRLQRAWLAHTHPLPGEEAGPGQGVRGSPPAPQVGLEVSGSTETPVGLNISVLSSLNIPPSPALEMMRLPGRPHACVSLGSRSLSEAVGILRSVLRLALAGRCRATSSVLADTSVGLEDGLPATRAPWGSTLSAAGAPWTHVTRWLSCWGGGRNSRNPCCDHCLLPGPSSRLDLSGSRAQGPRGRPNLVFSASPAAAGYVFCMLHRLPEQHDCTFDHMGRGREEAILKMVKLDRKVGRSCQRIGEGCS